MNYLAIDTSGKSLSIVLCKNDQIYTTFLSDCGVRHSTSLMPEIEKLIEKTDFDLKKVDFFCAVVGAGSFTGIRIGVSTIKAFCLAFNKPCLSVTSFDTIAYNKKDGKNLAVIDAKHNGYYVCGYNGNVVIKEPSYIDKETLIKLSKQYNLLSFEPLSVDVAVNCEKVDILQGLINAVEDKKNNLLLDANLLTPLYVRKSQAEEGRP